LELTKAKENTMKVLALNCAAAKEGDVSADILEAFLDGLQKKDVEIEFVNVKDLDISPCRGCTDNMTFEFDDDCRCEDDMNKLYPMFRESDVWIFGVSLEYEGTSYYLKNLLDRMEPLFQPVYFGGGDLPVEKPRAGKIILTATYGSDTRENLALLEEELRSLAILFSKEYAGTIEFPAALALDAGRWKQQLEQISGMAENFAESGIVR
jgi:multimeric flavodoxin WrbA